MGRQGCNLPDVKIKTIIRLLASTEMQISEIAERIGCSRSVIVSINRKHSVRLYEGKRNRWKMPRSPERGL